MTLRERIRLAAWLQRFWQRRPNPTPVYHWELLKSRWQSVMTALQKHRLADEHELQLCMPILRHDLLSALGNLSAQIGVVSSCYDEVEQEELTPRHWYEEVAQLEDEFVSISFDPQKGKLRVETPVITLGEMCLGAFAIELVKRDQELSIQCFQFIALDPEPPSTDSSVTHPHVKDQELCAGDAKVPIRKALESGRIADAFLLMLSVLQHYNGSSAFVKLEAWGGISCSSCSRSVSPDDSYHCRCCQAVLCDECSTSCTSCSDTLCLSCVQGCAVCKADCCESCLETSDASGVSLCRDCRVRCADCDKVLSIREVNEDDFCEGCAASELDDSDSEAHELEENQPKEVLAP